MNASHFRSLSGSGRLQTIIAIACLSVVLGTARASLPTDPAIRAQMIGHPTALVVQPQVISLTGPRTIQQIIVTGIYPDGTQRDLTPFSEMSTESSGAASVQPEGLVMPEKEGETVIRIQAAGITVRVPVHVTNLAKPEPVSFRHELIAALNVGGCNAGACHGTPSGKNGFRLSLRGYDPAADYLQLTRDDGSPHGSTGPRRQHDPAKALGEDSARRRTSISSKQCPCPDHSGLDY